VHKTPLCKPCHKQVHAMFSNKELAKLYGDMEALRGAEALGPFLKWIAKQKPDRNFRTVEAEEVNRFSPGQNSAQKKAVPGKDGFEWGC
jgi:hypothetical protein